MLASPKAKLWGADISHVPSKEVHSWRYDHRLYIRSDVVRAIEKAHGGKHLCHIVEDHDLAYKSRGDLYVENFISRMKEIYVKDKSLSFLRSFIPWSRIEIYMRAQWEKILPWWFYAHKDWLMRNDEHRLIKRSTSNGDTTTFNIWKRGTTHGNDPLVLFARKWISRNAKRLLKYHLDPSNFFCKRLQLKQYGYRREDIPPLVYSIWDICGPKFTADQENHAGRCQYCEIQLTGRISYSRRDYYSPFQYALHVYWLHQDEFFDEDAMRWRQKPVENEVLVRKTIVECVATPDSSSKTILSWIGLHCRWDRDSRRMVLIDDSLFVMAYEDASGFCNEGILMRRLRNLN